MANPEHLEILKQGVEAWNKWREENPNIRPDLSKLHTCLPLPEINFNGANLSHARFDSSVLVRADFSNSNLYKAYLWGTYLHNTNFYSANLLDAVLRNARMLDSNIKKANLGNADLRGCDLIKTDLTGAVLTGTKLYGTARDDWIIKDVKCQYVYWDEQGKQRSPKDRDLEPGEFERLYAALPSIEYIFENGMSPIDPLIMDRVVQGIREKQPEFDIKIDSINARGLAPSIKFTVQLEEHKDPALQEVRKEYELKVKQLESERDRYYQLVAHAIDTPKEVKLISVGPGGIVATDGSTINIQQHIHNALELQKAIVQEPAGSKTFAKVAKDKALDIVGKALEDVAKGELKEAAKLIFELGKDLGPILASTAAYAFFRSLLR